MSVVTAPNGDQRLHRDWSAADLYQSGVFRVAVVLIYSSNRRLTVPSNDQHTLVVTPDGSADTTWGVSVWDGSQWSPG